MTPQSDRTQHASTNVSGQAPANAAAADTRPDGLSPTRRDTGQAALPPVLQPRRSSQVARPTAGVAQTGITAALTVARVVTPTVRRTAVAVIAGFATEYAMRSVATRALTGSALGVANLSPGARTRRKTRTVTTEVLTVERRRR